MLDPAQNHSFRDHYLEINIDLSRVLFIATANQLGTIHPALLDRMEIISLAGYTEEDKVHIARQYLIPRQIEENGLAAAQLTIDDDAVRRMIAQYTREAGVRSLERQIGGGHPKDRRARSDRGGRRRHAPSFAPPTFPITSARRKSTTRSRSASRAQASRPASRGPRAAATCCSSRRACFRKATATSR